MTSDRELLVHLGGYSTIGIVLATADWAMFGGIVLAIPLVLGTLAFATFLGARWLIQRARDDVDLEETPTPVTDGGAAKDDVTSSAGETIDLADYDAHPRSGGDRDA